jgi:BA14K-like protein
LELFLGTLFEHAGLFRTAILFGRRSVLRPEGNFHPIWGAAAPATGLARTVIIAAAIGIAVGAAATSSLIDEQMARPAPSVAVPPSASQARLAHSVRTETVKLEPANALPPPQNTSPAMPNTSVPGNSRALDAEASQPAASDATPSDQPACNVSICEQYYQSFRGSDCTYQPLAGPRRYCTR